jgi:hypothetical protein
MAEVVSDVLGYFNDTTGALVALQTANPSAPRMGVNTEAEAAGLRTLASGAWLSADGLHRQGIGRIRGYQLLPKWNAALKAMKAGTRNARLALLGDSTDLGAWANGGSPTPFNGIFQLSTSTVLASLMAAGGIPTSTQSSFGDGTATGGSGTANSLLVDPRWAYGVGWATSTLTTLLGTIGCAGTNLTSSTFTPGGSYDTVEVYYFQVGGYGQFTISADGAQIGATVDCNGATSIQKTTRTFTARTGAISLNKTTTGQIYIAAVVCYLSTAKSVSVFNWGLGGSSAATWAAATNPWDASYPGGIMSQVAPDLTIINLNINDWLGATAAATYKASLRTVIAAAQVTGDVILRTGFPSAVGVASLANQLAITQACRQVAQDDGLPLIDLARFWGDYTTAVAAGYFAPGNDTVHAGPTGYANAAQCIFESI